MTEQATGIAEIALCSQKTEEKLMQYLVSPKWKKSVRYETTYKHQSRSNVFAAHEQYYRYENFVVEFHKDVDIADIRAGDSLSLNDTNIVVSY